MDVLQINEKGQLRLSRRALLPEPSPEKVSTKQRIGNPNKETTDTQKADEKGKLKKTSSGPKNDVKVDNVELPEDSSLDVKVSINDKDKTVEAKTPMEDKFVKKSISPGKDATEANKSRSKRSSTKPASTSKTSESPVVNGEAKVG